MLKTYKNELFEALRRVTRFSLTEFQIEDNHPNFLIRYKPFPGLYFKVQEHPNTAHTFQYRYTRFDPPRNPETGVSSGPIKDVTDRLRDWLDRDVGFAKHELEAPDLLAEFTASISPVSNETFSEQDKVQIRASILEFKVSIIKEFAPTEAQLHRISEKLDHLSESVDKLNRFDWSGVVINTLINIALDLALDPPKRQILIGLFKHAFGTLHLLVSAL